MKPIHPVPGMPLNQRKAFQPLNTLVWVCMLHVPLWLASAWFSMGWPVFSLDLLAAACVLGLSWRWGWATVLLTYVLDIVWFISQTYHFTDAAEFLDGSRFFGLLHPLEIISLPAILLIIATLLAIQYTSGWLRLHRPNAIWMLASLMVVCGLDVLNGSTRLFGLGYDSNRININIAGSPVANQVSLWVGRSILASAPMLPAKEHRLYDRAREYVSDATHRSVLLILVESMGEPSTPQVRAWLHGQLTTEMQDAALTFQADIEAFSGPTTYGELRSLCALNGHYSHLRTSDSAICLPRIANTAGRRAIALHGFPLRMFDRQIWWPQLGFETKPWTNVPDEQIGCNHVYRGVCDLKVLQTAVDLSAEPDRFVYALTLDSHLPLTKSERPTDTNLLAACRDEDIPPQSCALVNQTGWTLRELRKMLAALPVSARPRVIVAGDHAPPFLGQKERKAFVPTHIPVFYLDPVKPLDGIINMPRVSQR